MVNIVLGGQVGSEGKGKIAGYLAKEHDLSVRTGGPNAGHTVVKGNQEYKMRLVPCSFINRKCNLAMAAGSLINVELLFDELRKLDISNNRFFIDPQAGIIESKHINEEKELYDYSLSTLSGVGAATKEKLLRAPDFKLARDITEFEPFLKNVSEMINEYYDQGKRVLVEGTQGFDLSLHHGGYPYVTSRDTTTSTFLGEAGISPRLVNDIILVIRTYPIRSAKGRLDNELTWEEITKNSRSSIGIKEYASVTNNIRRVSKFNWNVVKRAIMINRPTQIALNFVDYIDRKNYKATDYKMLTKDTKEFIEKIETDYGVPVTLIGTGPDIEDTIDLRKEKLYTTENILQKRV